LIRKDFLTLFRFCRALFFYIARDCARNRFFNLFLFIIFFAEFFALASFSAFICSDYRYDAYEILHYRFLIIVFILALVSQSLFYDPDLVDPIPFHWKFDLFDSFFFVMCFLSGFLLLVLLDNQRYFMFVDLFLLFSFYQYIFLFLFWIYFFFYLPFNILEKFKKDESFIPVIIGQKIGYIIWVQCVFSVVFELSGACFEDPCTFACDKFFDEVAFLLFFNFFFIAAAFFFLPFFLTHIILFVVKSKIIIYIFMLILTFIWVFCACGVFFFIPSVWYEANDVFQYNFYNLSDITGLQLLYNSIGTLSFLLLIHLASQVHPFSGRIARAISYLFVFPIFYYCICFYNLALFAGTYDYYWEWPWTYYRNLAAKRID
jgi:hypothetical protein